jgi:hypothetical protein
MFVVSWSQFDVFSHVLRWRSQLSVAILQTVGASTGLLEKSLTRDSNRLLMQATFHTLACMLSSTSSIGCGPQQTRRGSRGAD